ncbi:MAG: organic solvent tolerance protein OstA [Bacteroidetes bacterium]|nr:organic solvent tolerance protein OstA [Bacteroidota bacterium]MBL6944667.1 organic solvent tolerance protein OstA [Bacteroidales bacterium]
MVNKLRFILLLLGAFFILTSIVAQQKSKVNIEHADYFRYNAKFGRDIQRLIGNVVIRQDSTLFSCDSAYINEAKNSFEAFSNVHIKVNDTVDVYGSRLLYEGNTKIAEFFDSVKLVDKNTVLTTDHLIYNRITKTAFYDVGGKIVNKDNILVSKSGLYFTGTRTFHFWHDVVLTNPDQETYSDTLIFNTNNETAYFLGPTVIRGKESTIYCEYGWYDTKNDKSKLVKRPSITNSDQTITADSLHYDNNTFFGKAMGNVQVVDTQHKVIITGRKGELWDKKGMSYVTDSAIAITYDGHDSLFIHADTMWMNFDKDRKAKMIRAYYGVRFYRKNLQGKCDSLSYNMTDSTIKLYEKPVLWSGKNQLTSDSIAIAVSGNRVDSLMMYNTAFIVSKDSTDTFNQIRGKNMIAYFVKNELTKINVNGNAQTIYYVREDDGYLIGVDLAESSSMTIKIKNNDIQSISYQLSVNEDMFPEKELTKEETRLKDFSWQKELRPANKGDIFKKEKSKN